MSDEEHLILPRRLRDIPKKNYKEESLPPNREIRKNQDVSTESDDEDEEMMKPPPSFVCISLFLCVK